MLFDLFYEYLLSQGVQVIDKENGGIEVSIYDMLNELKAYKNLDVYVTGGNSKGLSKDIATEFRDSATQIHVSHCPLACRWDFSVSSGVVISARYVP